MGRQSIREHKTIYQILREEAGMTREKAGDLMEGVSAARIEKIEYEQQEAEPYDVVQMAECYGRPELCNYYCSHSCEIGRRYIPEIKVSELSDIILETIASLNEINPMTNRLIQIGRDGEVSDSEIRDFALISKKLDEVSQAADALKLWVDRMAAEKKINMELLTREKQKLQ